MTKVATRISLVFGVPFAAFVAASPFRAIDHSIWLITNNGLVVGTLGGVVILGWRLRTESWPRTISAVLCYTSVLVSLFMGSYLTTTWFFADHMKWIPLFQRDYLYHGYSTVKEYLFAGNNYVELVKLNLFSWMIFSTAHVGLGALSAAASRYLGLSRRQSR